MKAGKTIKVVFMTIALTFLPITEALAGRGLGG
jgi:hypothetical protein